MSKPHICHTGDTLVRIAELRLGDRGLASLLADYNGLSLVDVLEDGQAVHLPPLRDLRPRRRPPSGPTRPRNGFMSCPPAPVGMQAIAATFGDIRQFPPTADNQANAKWESTFIASARLPLPIPLTWDTRVSARSLRCHRLLVPLYEALFADIHARGLWHAIKTTAGGYTWRMKRGQSKPSTHSWGIAFDLNDRTNAMGTPGDMDPALVALIESHGFVWGGRWSGAYKDPMHFQYCGGY